MSESTTTEVQSESGIAGVAQNFGLRGDLFLAQLLNFAIVLVVLWKFAYKPILKLVKDRESMIEKSVNDAKEIDRRLTELENERKTIIVEAQSKANAMLEKALADGETRKAEMAEAAKRDVEKIIAKGKADLAAEKDAMLIAVRKDIADIAVRAAAKIVMDGMTPAKAQSMADEMVRKMT